MVYDKEQHDEKLALAQTLIDACQKVVALNELMSWEREILLGEYGDELVFQIKLTSPLDPIWWFSLNWNGGYAEIQVSKETGAVSDGTPTGGYIQCWTSDGNRIERTFMEDLIEIINSIEKWSLLPYSHAVYQI